jgi:hypothetical protein
MKQQGSLEPEGREERVRREEGKRCSCTHSKCSQRLEAGGEV